MAQWLACMLVLCARGFPFEFHSFYESHNIKPEGALYSVFYVRQVKDPHLGEGSTLS